MIKFSLNRLCDQFLTKTSHSQLGLSNLLQLSLQGNVDSWQVFLDLLEEENLDLKEKLLAVKNRGSIAILGALADHFPQIQLSSARRLSITVPSVFHFEAVHNGLFFYSDCMWMCHSFSLSMEPYKIKFRRGGGESTHWLPLAVGRYRLWCIQQVDSDLYITVTDNDNWNSYYESREETIGPSDPDYSQIKSIFEEYKIKVDQDVANLERIFKIR